MTTVDPDLELAAGPGPGVHIRLLRGSAAYAGTSVAQRAASFLLLPIYLRAISPAEYGQLALLMALAAAASAALSFGLEAAIVRAYFQLAIDPEERRRYINTVGLFLIVVPAVVLLLVSALLVIANPDDPPVGYLILALAGAAAQVPATVLPLVILRLEDRLRDYVRLSAVFTLVSASLTLLLIVGLHLGVAGWLVATLAANLALLAGGLMLLGHRWSRHFSRRYLVAALGFGLPLVPHALAQWGLGLSDRAILGAWVSRGDLGIYNLGYQFAVPIGLFIVAINQAVTPILSRSVGPGGSQRGLSRVVTLQLWAAALMGLTAALLGPAVVHLLMPSSYARSADIVAWVALGYVMYGFYVVPMNAISVMKGNTRWVWIATVIAAAVNIGLNLLLVPRWGIYAAAVTTAIGYGTLLLTVSIHARITRAMTIPLETVRIIAGIAAIAAVYLAASVATGPSDLVGAAVRGAVVAAVAALLLMIEVGPKIPWPSANRVGR